MPILVFGLTRFGIKPTLTLPEYTINVVHCILEFVNRSKTYLFKKTTVLMATITIKDQFP